MEQLRCVVERITYQNAENGYAVIKCRAKGYPELVTVVGAMPDVHVGSVLNLGGTWKINAKYGRQFNVETFEETLPATVYGIEKYLGSGLIKGIGPAFASRIVKQFGEKTLEIIEEDPGRLMEIEGIGRVRVERILKSWEEQKEIKNIMLFLQSHDVSTAHAARIFKTYGADSLKVVQENPYRLADDIWGIGFKTADTIAEKLGFEKEKYVRLRSGLLYTLNRLSEEGHCYATRAQLLKTGAELLSVDEDVLSMTLDEMVRTGQVITEKIPEKDTEDGAAQEPAEKAAEKAIYLPPFYFSEVGTAKRLAAIFNNPEGVNVPTIALAEQISMKTGIAYDEIQMQAILTAVQSKILLLTGGPGTGKTTTTLGIITAFRAAGARILLAAPTGRAAKRLSEATHMEAKTIHRLLEVKPPEGYQKNEENPLKGDVLIVDECSMIDVMLMYHLLKAVPDTMTLILVGDIDQLPSVGAGNVLRDLIDSGCFPVVRLTRIFRQAMKSRIILNAHRINEGKLPDIRGGRESDFFFMDMEKQAQKKGLDETDSAVLAQEAAETITELVSEKLARYYHTPSAEIQVLTPMQRGVIGAANLNLLLQSALNPGGDGLSRGGYLFKAGDKVMQIRNNYEKEVFNGDIGSVESVDREERTLSVRFDDRSVTYDVSELDELVLAYAATIHKSQGSEYPIVVIPILMNHYVMLQRNLLYTGITRAKKILVLVGTRKALGYAVRNVTVENRNTMLSDRIRSLLPQR
ncbi:MAG: ATP-dependent RecD-like DNA helicase [Lachnospiraceae bacterium]|nr:ATP-dependent RecD-like DNA helicase [Lachnospiraceae bacterium]